MKKMNNKGFSLVELIVVIAIMAILAVTLAPRLTQYVEKARKGSDQEVIGAIYTAARLAVLDEKVTKELDTTYLAALAAGEDLGGVAGDALYVRAGKDWTPDITTSNTYDYADTVLMKEIHDVVGAFKLKSAEAGDDTTIKLTIEPSSDLLGYDVTVDLSYDGSAVNYTASDAAVRP